ncbi:UDP-glucose--hexose-1-phosphate uridylyltransferase [Maribacter sp. ANRC-HE7]|uniref:Galactose-1-phosphate uridylyltransferase n=1 Tax=Maribacter aquimaris TaxID=2737171 RepID=A0ABR7UZ14_9FLAO|nr:UDP-glucose--hexose-1-phosphate uridylyltransferase [Maribacter aquimaris]MBD0777536.1 UDP-glucose--hexose-1-phosphate uridylyltransferase [Maribacter aquimaris]
MQSQLKTHPHRRYNILTGEWVLVSPHRTKRPWQGKTESSHKKEAVTYDPECYLCPTNTRINGEINEDYKNTFVFKNDFGALLEDTPLFDYKEGLLHAEGEKGVCKVICFSPNHSLTIPDMELTDLVTVVKTWQKEFTELANASEINYVQIFENKGAIMGCSNPHPHGQIWAQHSIPTEIEKKTNTQKAHYQKEGTSLLQKYLEQELEDGSRIISQNDSFVTLVPFWAIWPYEAMIVPRRQMSNILGLRVQEREDFAHQLKTLTQKYDALFDTSFPYSSGIHQAPTDGKEYSEWHWHMSFYPPLLRSATIKKFMVGYEMFAMAQRDITPELAAEQLKSL